MKFSTKLMKWYMENSRDLPWRKTKDPYLIWIAEIILQQTRVNQGLNYFNRFVKKFPTVNELAGANEESVLLEWQGLGYYSRARNLLHSAKVIVNKYEGSFPDTYEDIITLKGIGDYTASAILSFAFNKPYPVVDGNVLRVLSRIYGITLPVNSSLGKSRIKEIAESLMPDENHELFNQAIMEFGALHCKPASPNCETCPFTNACFAYQHSMVEQLPVTEKTVKQKIRYFNYLVVVFYKNNNKQILFSKRNSNDIWKNMYDFPLIESDKPLSDNQIVSSELWLKLFQKIHPTLKKRTKLYKHILSHQILLSQFNIIAVQDQASLINTEGYLPVNIKEIKKYPVPRLIDLFLEEFLLEN